MREKIHSVYKPYSSVTLLEDDKGYYLNVHDKMGFKYRAYYTSKKAALVGLKSYGAKADKVIEKA